MLWGCNAPILEGDITAHSKLPTGIALNVPRWWAVSLTGEYLSSECYRTVFTRTLETGRGPHGYLFTSYALLAGKYFYVEKLYSHIPVHSSSVFHVSPHELGDSVLPSSLQSGLCLSISFISLTTEELIFLL